MTHNVVGTTGARPFRAVWRPTLPSGMRQMVEALSIETGRSDPSLKDGIKPDQPSIQTLPQTVVDMTAGLVGMLCHPPVKCLCRDEPSAYTVNDVPNTVRCVSEVCLRAGHHKLEVIRRLAGGLRSCPRYAGDASVLCAATTAFLDAASGRSPEHYQRIARHSATSMPDLRTYSARKASTGSTTDA